MHCLEHRDLSGCYVHYNEIHGTQCAGWIAIWSIIRVVLNNEVVRMFELSVTHCTLGHV